MKDFEEPRRGVSAEAVERAAYIRRECGRVDDIGPQSKRSIRYAVYQAMQLWPNAHLGDIPPREDMAMAFRVIRRRVASGESVYQAAAYLSADACRYADM